MDPALYPESFVWLCVIGSMFSGLITGVVVAAMWMGGKE